MAVYCTKDPVQCDTCGYGLGAGCGWGTVHHRLTGVVVTPAARALCALGLPSGPPLLRPLPQRPQGRLRQPVLLLPLLRDQQGPPTEPSLVLHCTLSVS
jgi:hypothetical protein